MNNSPLPIVGFECWYFSIEGILAPIYGIMIYGGIRVITEAFNV